MHRLIMDNPEGLDVDHKNGNGLDNRKCNLRSCSRLENNLNRAKRSDNTTGFKGVIIDKRKTGEKFLSRICMDGNTFLLGYFKTAIEAAKSYNEAAIKFHGEFARLNVIENV
jgi:hypothetical protein